MTNIYDPGEIRVSRDEFESFLRQYLMNSLQSSLDLIIKLRNYWLTQVDASGAIQRVVTMTLPATNSKFNKLFDQALGKPGAYAIFAKHPNHNPAIWRCFYVGISENNTRQRIVQHHCRDLKENYRNGFSWLGECTDVLSCYAIVDRVGSTKGELKLIEDCLTSKLRPWFLALAAGVEPFPSHPSCR